MRRRGFRGLRGRGRGGRLAEKLREIRELGLRDLRPIERPEGAPDELELALATEAGERAVVVVASRFGGPELVGWARVAALLAEGSGPEEAVIAAPSFPATTRRVASLAARRGFPLRLISAAGLAEKPESVVAQETFGADPERRGAPRSSLLEQVARVVNGAAAVTQAGQLRPLPSGHVLYLRGVAVLRLGLEGDGVAVSFQEPEKRHIHVTDGNFSRWGLELHESVVQLAQDPRLIERPEELAERAAQRAAAAAQVRVAASWIPWNDEGRDPLHWVGTDLQGRPVVGVVRARVGLAQAAELAAATELLAGELERWLPRVRGELRVVIATEQLQGRARVLLESLGFAVESRALEFPAEPAAEAASGRRRTRRRRGRRGAEQVARQAEEAAAPAEPAAPSPDEEEQARAKAGRGSGPRRRRAERAESSPGETEPAPERGASPDLPASPKSEEQPSEPTLTEQMAIDEALEAEAVAEAEEALELEAAAEPTEPALEEEIELEEGSETSAEEGAVAEAEQEEAPDPEEPQPLPRARRARAAICVRNELDAILAALVLARDRRHIPFFWVCAQEELMNFFRGKATDLDPSSDLLIVGFTAAPIPRETIGAAELFRGQIQWFDAHDWPIEDVEALRQAIGDDSVEIPERASSPLAAVQRVTERRSRFTDKLVDLAARRLSESDMAKWGYKLVGLIRSLGSRSGDHRQEIHAVLAGKPAELPEVSGVYSDEEQWLEAHDPKVVYFGEYQLAVVRVPQNLDAGEVARRARLKTGARLSLATREGDPLVILGANDEKRPINLGAMVEKLEERMSWAHARPAGDRLGRFFVDLLDQHPERLEAVIGEIARNRSALYG